MNDAQEIFQEIDRGFNHRIEEFRCYRGFPDRVIFGNPVRQGWVGFWDWDHSEPPSNLYEDAKLLDRNLLLFHSGHGYHVMALDVGDWSKKLEWFEHWKQRDPSADYILQRNNVLRLNDKNGSSPKFIADYFIRPMEGSLFHMQLIYQLTGLDVLATLYPKFSETYGRIKRYASDPNNVFEVMMKK